MQPELHVQPNIYAGAFPRFDRPKVIGYIGSENIKFANQIQNTTKVNFDLNLHLDKAKRKPCDLDVKLTDLLRFLLSNETRLQLSLENDLKRAPFLCYRGLMTCLACTPYENQEAWKIVAVLYKGSIYLCARDTEAKKAKKKSMTEQEKKFSSWGYKFEQYLLSDMPDSKPNPNLPVDETEEFSLVFQTHLNQHKIIYGAEMDGIRCDKGYVPPPPNAQSEQESILEYLSTKSFIELKTSRHIEFPNQERNFRRFKTKKWWCQSFLVGIDTILCGFRNDDGIVEELRTYNTRDLAKMSQKFWDPNVCFNFLDSFLSYVKRCLAREIEHKYGRRALNDLQKLPLTTMLFEWSPGMPVQATTNYVHEDDPILHEWFISNFCKNIQYTHETSGG